MNPVISDDMQKKIGDFVNDKSRTIEGTGKSKTTSVSDGYTKTADQIAAEGKKLGESDILTKEQGDALEAADGDLTDYQRHARMSTNDWANTAREIAESPQVQESLEQMSKIPGCNSANKLLSYMKNRKDKPKQNWKMLLRRYMKGAFNETVTKFPKKKHVWRDYYRKYDTSRGESGKNLIVLLDTSGSMMGDPIKKCLREINSLAIDLKVERVWLVQGDYSITSVDEITPKNRRSAEKQLDVVFSNMRGFGGTSFDNMFAWVDAEYVDKLKKKPQCVIIMTDGGDRIPRKPKWADKLIWFIADNPKFYVPYGKIVYAEIEEKSGL